MLLRSNAFLKPSLAGKRKQRHSLAPTQVTVLKQGYLLKKSSGLRKEWKNRFFVLDSSGMLYYYSAKVILVFRIP